MRYVIIGNSAAAIGGVEGTARVDAASPIALISAEPHHTYSRPLISYLLWGKTDEERMLYRPRDYYEKMGVTPCWAARRQRSTPQSRSCACRRPGRPLRQAARRDRLAPLWSRPWRAWTRWRRSSPS